MEVARHNLRIKIPTYNEELEEIGSIQPLKRRKICSRVDAFLNKMLCYVFVIYHFITNI